MVSIVSLVVEHCNSFSSRSSSFFINLICFPVENYGLQIKYFFVIRLNLASSGLNAPVLTYINELDNGFHFLSLS